MLVRMVYFDIQPAVLLLVILPLFALIYARAAGLARALAAVAIWQVGPLLMLAMGAWLYGQGGSRPYLWKVQLLVGVLGVGGVIPAITPLVAPVPKWVFASFFVAVAVTSLLALFVGGMALYDDWL